MSVNKWLYIFGMVVLVACSNEHAEQTSDSKNEENTVLDEAEGIVEHDLNKERINAVEFNNKLTLIQQNISHQIEVLFQSDSSNIQQQYKNTLFEIEINLHELKSYKVDDGEHFLSAITDLINFYKNELMNNFPPLVQIIENGIETDAEFEKLELYDVRFAEEEAEYLQKIFEAQNKFAEDNRIKLES